MQILWSRAAQARSSCRCSSCLHSATTAARRITAAAPKRRLRLGDVFTACYSSLLASAAIADAGIKDERRRAWDKLIAETKAEVQALDEGLAPQIRQDGIPEVPKAPQEAVGWGPMPKIDTNINIPWLPAPPMRLRDMPEIPVQEQQKESPAETEEISRNLETPTTAQELLQWHAMPKKMDTNLDTPSPGVFSLPVTAKEKPWASEPEFVPRYPTTPLHLLKMEDMVAKLVDDFLGTFKSKLAPTHPDYRQSLELARKIARLKNGFTQCPHFYWSDFATVKADQSSLVAAFDSLCIKAGQHGSSITLLVLKICYNLLTSRSPPDIEMYNVLLYHFTKMEQHTLGQILVDSFFKDSKFKPSLKTVCLFIDHFSACNNRTGLWFLIERMRGVGGGIRIRRRSVRHLADPLNAAWASSRKIVERHGHLFEMVARNSEIFNRLIHACVHLGDLGGAVRFIEAAFREDQKVDFSSLDWVIKLSIKQKNYQRCLRLLRCILGAWSEGKISLVLDISNVAVRCAIHRLIGLQKHLSDFIESSDNSVTGLLRYLQIESLSNKVDDSASVVQALNDCFDNHSNTGSNVEQQVEVSLEILRYAKYTRQHSGATKQLNLLLCRSDILLAMEKQLDDIDTQNQAVNTRLINFPWLDIPEPWRAWILHYQRYNPPVNRIETTDFVFELYREYKAGRNLKDYVQSNPLMRRPFDTPREVREALLVARQEKLQMNRKRDLKKARRILATAADQRRRGPAWTTRKPTSNRKLFWDPSFEAPVYKYFGKVYAIVRKPRKSKARKEILEG